MSFSIRSLQDRDAEDLDLLAGGWNGSYTTLGRDHASASAYDRLDASLRPSEQHDIIDPTLSHYDAGTTAISFTSGGYPPHSQPDLLSRDAFSAISNYNFGDAGYPGGSVPDADLADSWTVHQDSSYIDSPFLTTSVPSSMGTSLPRSHTPFTVSPSDVYSTLDVGSPVYNWGGFSLGSSSLSRSHGPSITEESNGTCQACNMTFGRRSELRRHLKKHEAPRSYLCSVEGCTKTFARRDKLRDHTRQGHKMCLVAEEPRASAKSTLLQCEICDQEFTRRADLNAHHTRKHDKKYDCSDCGKSFGLRADLQRHKVVHEGRDGRHNLQCTVLDCDYSCQRKDNLQRHIRKKHSLAYLSALESASKSVT